MRVNYQAIKADADALGLSTPELAYPELLKLTDDIPRTSYLLNERTITRALIQATSTPYADAVTFMNGVTAAGAAGDIPSYLVDDLAGEGLNVCDPLISAALTSLEGKHGITTDMVTRLLALQTEAGVLRYPDLKLGHVVDAFLKSDPTYGAR